MEKYKIYAAMVALEEFTVADLAQYTGVKKNTVGTIVGRSLQYLEELGRDESGRPGGQYERYRVRPEQVEALLGKLKPLTQIANILPLSDVKVPADLKVAEEALVKLYPVAKSRAERQQLIDIAKMSLRGGRMEFESDLSSRNASAADAGAYKVVQTHINFVESLTRYSEEMFSLELDGDAERIAKLQAARDEFINFFQTQLSILEGEQKQTIPLIARKLSPVEVSPSVEVNPLPPSYMIPGYGQNRADGMSTRIFAPKAMEDAGSQQEVYVLGSDRVSDGTQSYYEVRERKAELHHIILFDGIGAQPDPLTPQVESFLRPIADPDARFSVETIPLTNGRLLVPQTARCHHDLCLLTVDSREQEPTEAFKSVVSAHGNSSHLIVVDAGYSPQFRNAVFSNRACYVGDGLSLNKDALWGTITQKIWKF